MAGITLDQADSRLTEYINAESAVLSGQSYSIGGRSLTRANLKEIRDGIDYWEKKVASLSPNRGVLIRGMVPLE